MGDWIFSENTGLVRATGRKMVWPELLSDRVRGRKPSSWTYVKSALFNGANGIVAGTVCMAGLATSSSTSLLVLAGMQAAVAAAAPRLPFFRKLVNRKIESEEEQTLSRERASILSQMDCEHARMLETMETMFESVHEESQRRPQEKALKNNTLAHERLLACFARLAIAHKRVRDHLLFNPLIAPTTERRIPLLSLGRPPIRTEREKGSRLPTPGRVADVHWQRCELQRKHMEVRWRNEERLALIEQQLGVIYDLARLIHEQSAADPTVEWIEDDLEELFEEIDRSGQAFEEWEQQQVERPNRERMVAHDEERDEAARKAEGKILTLPALRREAHL